MDLQARIKEMKAQLRDGPGPVVAAAQLFRTPARIAQQMAVCAQVEQGMRVLEPSAGTGRLLRVLPPGAEVVAVELSEVLADHLRHRAVPRPGRVLCRDFLSCTASELGTFDRVIMNPPFVRGRDIDHILHAFELLRDGGRLVALCADGPRQAQRLRPAVQRAGGIWRPLGEVFRGEGTGVRCVMLSMAKGGA